jgi:monoamine oxidase
MPSSGNDAEIIIIGAGLSGLTSALLLAEAGRSVCIVEARSRPGGRIRSVFDDDSGAYVADLGPTWIWPAFQPIVSRWIDKLALEVVPQFETGKAVLDYGPGAEPESRFFPGQESNMRVMGGMQEIIDRLVSLLPDGVIMTNSPVRSVSINAPKVELEVSNDAYPLLKCDHVIVAIPPRIAAASVRWNPELPAALMRALQATPTWMAPHAKVVARYKAPFWREMGLSGRIASKAGPIVEGHDHCGPESLPAAIFGFVGWSHDMRVEAGPDLKLHVQAQLKRCFGATSPDPLSVHIEDWASDPLVATPRDLSEPMSHPDIGPYILRQSHANEKIWFAGSETAQRGTGLVEGAFDAAEQTVVRLLRLETALHSNPP